MISIENLSLRQGNFRLDGIDLDVAEGEYVVLMGTTGSGKTSLLEALCGLRPVAKGRILIDGRNVTHLSPAMRGVGYVPQDGALFPTMSVHEQLGFALDVRNWAVKARDERVEELAEQLGISHLLDRMPAGLSGGERQRVALGRALAARPGVLLLDEPLSALDDETRAELYNLIGDLRRSAPFSALHVTHSSEEAEHLGDRILRLSAEGVLGSSRQ